LISSNGPSTIPFSPDQETLAMMTGAQLKAARALVNIDQQTLSKLSGVSLTTIRRMEASVGIVRSNVDTLVKVIEALEQEGVELIGENSDSLGGGRGVRLKN
jgi:DNA-binding XRE family transcriptional regulator